MKTRAGFKPPSKPTPGPWRVAPDGMHPRSIRRVIKGGKPERSLIIVEDWTPSADAQLMATAPDLYRALQLAERLLRADHGADPCDEGACEHVRCPALRAAQAALKKATEVDG